MIPPVLVLGSRAMGCLFSWRLAAAGIPVTVLSEWQDGVDSINNKGVCRVYPSGEERAYPVKAFTDPSQCQGVKAVIVLTKSWQTRKRAGWLQEILPQDGIALTLQNGLGNYETLVEFIGTERAAAGSSTSGSTLVKPGHFRALGEGEIILAEHPRLAPLSQALEKAEFRVQQVSDLQSVLWGKLVINAAINPLTALLDVPNGYLLKNPQAWDIACKLADETAGVARALGVDLPYPDPHETIRKVLVNTGKNSSSMRQDLFRLAPTEIDAINGAVVKTGRQQGVPVVHNEIMCQLISARLEALSSARL